MEVTFTFEKSSDKQGNIEFTQIVPERTQEVYVLMGGGTSFPYEKYKIQAKKNNIVTNDNSGPTIAVYPDSTNSLVLGESNDYELILTKK